MLEVILVGTSIVISAITSAIVTSILATHHFKIVDSYVDNVCKMTVDHNREILDLINKKLK